jgi:hypothetical protein
MPRTTINQELSIVTDQLNSDKFVAEIERVGRLEKYGVLTAEQAKTERAKYQTSPETVASLQSMTGKIVRGYFSDTAKVLENRSLHAELKAALVFDPSDENLFRTVVSFGEETVRIAQAKAEAIKAAK